MSVLIKVLKMAWVTKRTACQKPKRFVFTASMEFVNFCCFQGFQEHELITYLKYWVLFINQIEWTLHLTQEFGEKTLTWITPSVKDFWLFVTSFYYLVFMWRLLSMVILIEKTYLCGRLFTVTKKHLVHSDP